MWRYASFGILAFTLGCASPRATRATAASAIASVCPGYEDLLSLADRPLTPCETDTPARPAREVRSPWLASYNGPCQFVDVQVVVDSLGRLEPGSPSVYRTNAPAAASDVVQEMTTIQYVPARLSGRPVRQVRRFHFESPHASARCEA